MVWEDPVVGMAVAARLSPTAAPVAGIVIEVATAIEAATMVDVRVAVTVIAAVPAVVISADSVARWVLGAAPEVTLALVDSAEIVVMDSDLQNAAGKQEEFMPLSTVL